MMEVLKEEFINEMKNILGERTKNGACVFCGKSLNKGEYCNCDKAKKINRYFKKCFRKIMNYNDRIVIGGTLEQEREQIRTSFKIPGIFEGVTFDDYEVECDSEKRGKAAVVDYFKNSIRNYIYGKNLVLIGGFGTGKTMLESILCKKLSETWLFKCQFINAVDLKGEITKCFSSKSSKTVDEVVDRFKTADFLFLDDIDKLTPTEYVREFIYSLVNYRVENQLPIITSANHTLEDLDSKFYGEAIVSRLINNSPVVIFEHKNRRF